MTAIILAGGLGTRLQSIVNDVPKPMADINGKPFLEYIFYYLLKYNITDVILSVGYKQEIIKNYFKNKYKTINILYSSEDIPLGTGGAIKHAMKLVNNTNSVLIINGDTFFDINLINLYKEKDNNNFDIIIALKELSCFDRYGSVIVKNNIIEKFQKKKFTKKGYINGGIYILNKNIFNNYKTLDSFSFEDFLENNLSKIKAYAYISNNSYFIDIGIPEDYKQAKIDFKEKF